MTSEFFGPLPPSDFNRDAMQRWLDQQVVSFQKIITGSLQADNVLSSSNYVPGVSGWMIDGDGNAEFNDVEVRGDIISGNWDGADPIDLSSYDATASAGFALDSSVGAAQFMGPVRIGGDSNQRIEILKVGTIPRMEFYSTNALVGVISAPAGQLYLQGPASAGLTIEGDQNAFIDLVDSKITFLTSESATVRATISNTSLSLTVPVLIPGGSVSAPGLAFTSNPDLGIYTTGSDIRFALDGVNDFIFHNSTLTLRDGASDPEIRWADASLSTSRRYRLYRNDDDFDSLTLTGTNSTGTTTTTHLRLVDGQTFSPGIAADTTTNPANVEIDPSSGRIRRSTATMWHSGNDGSGSGLDADLLDGQHASAFATSGHGHSLGQVTGHTLSAHRTLGLAEGGATIASTANAHYDETIRLVRRATSTIRAKREVEPLLSSIRWSQGSVLDLTPSRFQSRLPDDDPDRTHLGLIAEDVAAHIPEAASYDRQGRPDGVEWNAITALLIDEVKGLNARVAAMEQQLAA